MSFSQNVLHSVCIPENSLPFLPRSPSLVYSLCPIYNKKTGISLKRVDLGFMNFSLEIIKTSPVIHGVANKKSCLAFLVDPNLTWIAGISVTSDSCLIYGKPQYTPEGVLIFVLYLVRLLVKENDLNIYKNFLCVIA